MNNTIHRISEFLVGLLFGLGLILSGMTDPGKVIGFLTCLAAGTPLWRWSWAGPSQWAFLPSAWPKNAR